VNKSLQSDAARSFLELASKGKIEEAFRDYVGSGFSHHNPYFPGDLTSLKKGMEDNARKYPEKTFEIHHILEEGNFVAVHSRVVIEQGTLAIVHIFRFEGGRIVEMWDIAMANPENPVNELGMF
jgi:predicted SnoaL-like aldol condensation-catalyzing enzyme